MPSIYFDEHQIALSWLSILILGFSIVFFIMAIFTDYRAFIISAALFLIHYIIRCIIACRWNKVLEDVDD